MMKPKIHIVDTTLRDGEQSAGFAMTKQQKVFIASLLDSAGVYQIEAGIPAMGKYERDTLKEIILNKKNSLISVWNRISISDIKNSIECNPDIMHISVPVSYPQIYSKLRKNKTWVINSVKECIDFAMNAGFKVTIGFEDASRADFSFMLSLANFLKENGIDQIRIADTVGTLSPSRTFTMISDLIKLTGIDVEMHAHNDLGMAVANSVVAAKAGAKYIDTTIFGIGERTGNCDFQKFIYAANQSFEIIPDHLTSLLIEDKTSHLLKRDS